MSDLGLSGSNDWGVHAPGTSEACAEGALTAFRDWGGFAASPHPACEEGEQSGADDWGDYAPVVLPDLGEGAITGAADWGKYAPIALPDFGEGAFTGWDDWGEYAAQEGTTLAASDLESAARQNWILSRYLGGKLWEYDDFESDALKWFETPVGPDSSIALSTVASTSGSQSCAITAGAGVGRGGDITRNCVRSPVQQEGFGVFFMTSDLDVTVEIKVEAYIDGVKQTAALLWDLQANSVQYYGADSAYHAKETVKAFPAGVGSHNFMQIVVDWENTKTVRMRANDTVIGVDAAHHSVAAAGEADRIKVFIGYTNLEAVSHVGYFDDFVYTYDEPVI